MTIYIVHDRDDDGISLFLTEEQAIELWRTLPNSRVHKYELNLEGAA